MNTDKVALVTGANKGIGFATARALAQTGAVVLLGGRSMERVREAADVLARDGLSVRPIHLDVTNAESIAAAVASVESEYGVLDILVNNAAVRVESYGLRPSEQPLKAWRDTFDTNLFGVVQTTVALRGLVERSAAGRIVNVSSLLGSIGTHTDTGSYTYSETFKSLPAYSAAKSALNSWTVHLAWELRDTAVKVNAVHPGYTRTDLNDGDGDQEVQSGAKSTVLMALLDDAGPSGTFTHVGSALPW